MGTTDACNESRSRWGSRYGDCLRTFLTWTSDQEWDYLLPVARKCCKLLSAHPEFRARLGPRADDIRYRSYFEYFPEAARGARVLVIDDATRRGATLAAHRALLESLGATVATAAFVGHEDVRSFSYDRAATVHQFVSAGAYAEYMILLGEHLRSSAAYPDIDHLVIEVSFARSLPEYKSVETVLWKSGDFYYLDPPGAASCIRGSLDRPCFYPTLPAWLPRDEHAPWVGKIRFGLRTDTPEVLIAPLVFPPRLSGSCPAASPHARPIVSPLCATVLPAGHAVTPLCYVSISTCLSAELLRGLFRHLAHELGWNELAPLLRTHRLRVQDLRAHFGPQHSEVLAQELERLFSPEPIPGEDDPCPRADPARVPPPRIRSARADRVAGVKSLLEHLRGGYARAVEQAGTYVGVHFFEPLDRLPTIMGLDWLDMTDLLDEYCDAGVIVPQTTRSEGPNGDLVGRCYRAGEPDLDLAWRRTELIIPYAIELVSKERRHTRPFLGAKLTLKLLANFMYDFPSYGQDSAGTIRRTLHSLYPTPWQWGTLPVARHPLNEPRGVTPYSSDRLGGRYVCEDAPQGMRERQVFRAIGRGSEGIEALLDHDTDLPVDRLTNYFKFLASVSMLDERANAVNALSLCRTADWFYAHLMWNIRAAQPLLWSCLQSGEPPGAARTETTLRRGGAIISGAQEKLDLWAGFPGLSARIAAIGGSPGYRHIWNELSDTIVATDASLPRLTDLRLVVALQRFLGTLMLALHSERWGRENSGWLAKTASRAIGLGAPADMVNPLVTQSRPGAGIAGASAHLLPLFQFVDVRTQHLPLPRPVFEHDYETPRAHRGANAVRAMVVAARGRWDILVVTAFDLAGSKTLIEKDPHVLSDFYTHLLGALQPVGGAPLDERPSGNDLAIFLWGSVEESVRGMRSVSERYSAWGSAALRDCPLTCGMAAGQLTGRSKEDHRSAYHLLAEACYVGKCSGSSSMGFSGPTFTESSRALILAVPSHPVVQEVTGVQCRHRRDGRVVQSPVYRMVL